MDISIKTIRGFTLTNLMIFGLAACSNTPAPWVEADDSPWGAKHEAEAQAIPSDEAVADTSLNDPALLGDAESELEVEPVIMAEPEAAAAPELIAPVVVEDETSEIEVAPVTVVDEPVGQDIMSMPGSYYAVQVYASKTNENVEKFKNSKGLDDLLAVKTDRSGSIVYVLVDIYSDLTQAKAAADELEIKIGSKPWIRPLGGLQKIVAQ